MKATVQMNIRLTPEIHTALKAEADRRKESVHGLLVKIIEKLVAR